MTDDLVKWLRMQIYTARFSAQEALAEWPPDDEIALQVESIRAGAFVHRNNPRVVLNQCDAYSRILARHEPRVAVEGGYVGKLICGCSDGVDEYLATPWPCDDVRDLASVYQEEEGYREEWRP